MSSGTQYRNDSYRTNSNTRSFHASGTDVMGAGGKLGFFGWMVVLILAFVFRSDVRNIFASIFNPSGGLGPDADADAESSGQGLYPHQDESKLTHERPYYGGLASSCYNELKVVRSNISKCEMLERIDSYIGASRNNTHITNAEEMKEVFAFFGVKDYDEQWPVPNWSGGLRESLQHRIDQGEIFTPYSPQDYVNMRFYVTSINRNLALAGFTQLEYSPDWEGY